MPYKMIKLMSMPHKLIQLISMLYKMIQLMSMPHKLIQLISMPYKMIQLMSMPHKLIQLISMLVQISLAHFNKSQIGFSAAQFCSAYFNISVVEPTHLYLTPSDKKREPSVANKFLKQHFANLFFIF